MTEAIAASAENWPQWRGPSGDGISAERNPPVRWSRDENVLWRVPIEGLGSSTPIIWGDRIFLTSQTGSGPSAGGNDFQNAQTAKGTGERNRVEFLVLAYRRENGRLLWEHRLPARGNLPSVHIKHNLASPSCVTDGERVYAWFGDGQVVALTLDGDLVWKRHLGEEIAPFDVRWGHGSSPALYEGKLLLLVDHPPGAYLLAINPATGKEVWRFDRGEGKRSYTTPFVIETEKGDQIVINTNERVEAIDPETGEVIWHVGESNRVPVATPVYHDGTLYSSRGYHSGPFLAVRVDGGGEASEGRLKWRVPTGAPYVGSLLYYQGLLYMATERGIASAVDAETGDGVWKKRLGGVFTASPVAADGKVYFVEESGKTFVVKAGREGEVLAVNDLGERTLASPAIAEGRLYLRTDDQLWAVGASAQ